MTAMKEFPGKWSVYFIWHWTIEVSQMQIMCDGIDITIRTKCSHVEWQGILLT